MPKTGELHLRIERMRYQQRVKYLRCDVATATDGVSCGKADATEGAGNVPMLSGNNTSHEALSATVDESSPGGRSTEGVETAKALGASCVARTVSAGGVACDGVELTRREGGAGTEMSRVE